MTRRGLLVESVLAVLAPLIVVASYFIVMSVMLLTGYGPAAAFLRDAVSGSSNVLDSATTLSNFTRGVLMPMVVMAIAIGTARSSATGASVVTAAIMAAIIGGGYKSGVSVALHTLVYLALGGIVRVLRRRRIAPNHASNQSQVDRA
jgi:hypothetical protein